MSKLSESRILQYNQVVALCPKIELKGKNNPYTSANGHMFSQLNKDGQLGIRFSKEVQEQYINDLRSDYFKSYGATMRGYVLIPERLWDEPETIAKMLKESYNYVMSLDPK